jgi:hypothetical protein
VLVKDDKYRKGYTSSKEYIYSKNQSIELLIPVGDRIMPNDKYSVSIDLNHASTGCPFLSAYPVDLSTCKIPSTIVAQLKGSIVGHVLIKNNITNITKSVRILLNERS